MSNVIKCGACNCRYKEQVHGEMMKEDEKDTAEIERMFPSYEQVLSVINESSVLS